MDARATMKLNLQDLGSRGLCELREREESWRKLSLWLEELDGWRCHYWNGEGRRRSYERLGRGKCVV